MYGFNDQKLLSWPLGREISQIALGEHDVIFRFYPSGQMIVTGAWQLLDRAGQVVDRSMEHSEREAYRLHRLLGASVSTVQVESSTVLTLTFGDGFRLRLEDDDPRYEAVVMDPGDGTTIVV